MRTFKNTYFKVRTMLSAKWPEGVQLLLPGRTVRTVRTGPHCCFLSQMRGERAGRARTVPSTLGSLESSPGSLSDLTGSEVAAVSQNRTAARHTPPPPPPPTLTATSLTPGALKKTVTLLSPEVLTNWYEKRKKEAAYGPRRNSISNLFFQPGDKKQSSPVVSEGPRGRDKCRGSMLNLEEILAGEGVLSRHHARVGKGIQRSESAKLTNDSKLEVTSHLQILNNTTYMVDWFLLDRT